MRRFLNDGLRWDVIRSLELALFRTYAIPAIGDLLAKTGEFERNGQKRYDDTTLLLLMILREGADSVLGGAAIQRMNRSHAHYRISNADFLFVLSTFVLDPIRWCRRYAWRALTPAEEQALFVVWKDIGRRMGLTDIPTTLAQMEADSDAYAAQHFRHTPGTEATARATIRIVEGWLPRLIQPLAKPTLAAVADNATLAGVGLQRPPAAFVATIRAALRLRGWLMRRSSALRRWLECDWPSGSRTYPSGYAPEQLAPQRLLAAEARRPEKQRIGQTRP